MLILRHEPSLLLLFVAGTAIGALSWLAAYAVSGVFEPYDSSLGLLVNQVVLSAPAAFVAYRYRASASLVLLVGAYVGMNAYAYSFGGSEHRVWAALGAVVSTMLLLAPVLLALGAVAYRRLRRGPP